MTLVPPSWGNHERVTVGAPMVTCPAVPVEAIPVGSIDREIPGTLPELGEAVGIGAGLNV